jgi:hypothetical protein
MSTILLAGQVILGLAFVYAAIGKMLTSEDFSDAIRISGLRASLIGPVGIVIVCAETAVTIGSWQGDRRILQVASAAAALMLIAFTFWMIWMLRRGLSIRCGCFGSTTSRIGLMSVIRNLALLCVAILTISLSLEYRSVLPPINGQMLYVIVGAALIIALGRAFWFGKSALLLTLDDVLEATRT